MTAAGAVNVIGSMPGAGMLRRAVIGIRRSHSDHVLVNMVSVGMMEMSIMQVVHMPIVLYGDMSAAGAMLVIMLVVVGLIASCHAGSPGWGKRFK